jgi:NAD(P)-dependent dehydrogenase (short-subunit alcohol dehydrogenase family)
MTAAASGLVDGKIALVTGSASGIGRAAAQLFAAEGASVMCSDIDSAGGEETAELIRKDGGTAMFAACDVSDVDAMGQLVRVVLDQFGRLDCAVNCAGVPGPHGQLLADYDASSFDRTFAVNARGVWASLRAEIPAMVAQGGGAIVNVASVTAFGALPTVSAYGATKSAIVGLTRSAAVEYAAAGVRVNAVCPGSTRTPMADTVAGGQLEALMELLVAPVPMKRIAEPAEIAEVAIWLCSDRASYVTGTAFPVDGGITASLA